MSRIGKQPVAIPAAVKVKIEGGKVLVEGPKGKNSVEFHRNMKVEYDTEKKALLVTRPDDNRVNRALHGLTRSLLNNLIEGGGGNDTLTGGAGNDLFRFDTDNALGSDTINE